MADNEMLRVAEAEVQRLEALLAATDEYKKLQLAKQVVAMYSASNAAGGAAKQTARPFQADEPPQHETKRAQIDRLASEFLRARSRRAKVSEIWPHLESAGVELGDEPMKALSA